MKKCILLEEGKRIHLRIKQPEIQYFSNDGIDYYKGKVIKVEGNLVLISFKYYGKIKNAFYNTETNEFVNESFKDLELVINKPTKSL